METSAAAVFVWKLPVAYGMRLPIFSVTFCPSEARTCGLFSTFVLVSDIIACSSPPGSDAAWLKSWIGGQLSPARLKVDGIAADVVVGVVVARWFPLSWWWSCLAAWRKA